MNTFKAKKQAWICVFRFCATGFIISCENPRFHQDLVSFLFAVFYVKEAVVGSRHVTWHQLQPTAVWRVQRAVAVAPRPLHLPVLARRAACWEGVFMPSHRPSEQRLASVSPERKAWTLLA